MTRPNPARSPDCGDKEHALTTMKQALKVRGGRVIDQRRGRSVGVVFQDQRVAAEQQAVAVVHFTRRSLGHGFRPRQGSRQASWAAMLARRDRRWAGALLSRAGGGELWSWKTALTFRRRPAAQPISIRSAFWPNVFRLSITRPPSAFGAWFTVVIPCFLCREPDFGPGFTAVRARS
jgi:hypothetical protein